MLEIDRRWIAPPRSLDSSETGARPLERLERLGVGALTENELLALILRSGGPDLDALALAGQCLSSFGGIRNLAGESVRGLQRLPGLGPAKAASLQAAFELGRRLAARSLERGRPISSPLDVHRAFLPWVREQRRESFRVLLLDARHRLLAVRLVSVGTLTASLVHPREVFGEAIREAAAAIVVLHNHPSGDPRPSREDRDVTHRLHQAGELLGIQLVDHVIVAEGGYFSFREDAGGDLGSAVRVGQGHQKNPRGNDS